jgi:CelD/BcsL family acetyltransferase involved in cellulose biosynthesis
VIWPATAAASRKPCAVHHPGSVAIWWAVRGFASRRAFDCGCTPVSSVGSDRESSNARRHEGCYSIVLSGHEEAALTLRLSIVTEPGALEACRDDWRALLERSSAPSPSLAPEWLSAWWRVFGAQEGRQLRVGLFHRGERLVGLAPLLFRRHRYRFALPFRRLELIGSGENESDEICSDYLGVLAEATSERDVCRGLAAALASGQFGSWDELVMPAMDGRRELPGLLRRELLDAGFYTDCRDTNACPFIPLPKSWEAYLALLPSTGRYRIKRSLRDFEKWAAGTERIERVERREDLERGAAILRTLHEERWRGEGRAGVFASSRFARFHAEVMPELWENGSLELSWLTVREQPVAALYNIVQAGTVYFYQSGRRLELPKGIRPGIVLHAHAIRAAIEAGHREYDFLAGVSRYKMELALATRPLVTLRAARPSFIEALRSWTEVGVDTARSLRGALVPERNGGLTRKAERSSTQSASSPRSP